MVTQVRTSPTDTLLEFAETWRSEPLPALVSHRTAQVVIDTVASYIGGTALEAGKILLEFAARSKGDVGLFPIRGHVSAEAASYAASSLANLIDADEALYNRGHHACVTVMPALIVGAQYGRSVGEVMRAIAVGFEISARTSMSWSYYQFEDDGSLKSADVTGVSWAVLGAAVALGLLRGLDERALRSAFGIAAYSAPIPTNSNWHVSYELDMQTKYTLYGAAAQSTVSAVELAALGFRGPSRVLDGPRGFRRLIGATECQDDVLAQGIPGTWAICEAGLKRYPACRAWHGALYGVERLVGDNDLLPSAIQRVDIRLPMLHPSFQQLVQEYPRLSEISAQFSAAYGCAQLIQRRPIGPDWYRPDALRNEQNDLLMRSIQVSVDPLLHAEAAAEVRRVGHYGRRLPWAVSILSTRGDRFDMSGVNAPGDPFDPVFDIQRSETEEKFRQFYAQAIGAKAPEDFLELVYDDNASCAQLLNALG